MPKESRSRMQKWPSSTLCPPNSTVTGTTHFYPVAIRSARVYRAQALNPNNLIHGNPAHRNSALSEAAALLGYCEKSGSGIDIVYGESVAAGFDFPSFEGDGESFKAILP